MSKSPTQAERLTAIDAKVDAAMASFDAASVAMDATIARIESLLAPAVAAPAAPAVAAAPVAIAAAPVSAAADPLTTGKHCTCGHEHKRPVVLAERARLTLETACQIKGCVSHPDCHAA